MVAKLERRTVIERQMKSGEAAYERYRSEFLSDPQRRAMYEEEAAKGELWLQLVEARMHAGLTQAQVAKRLGVSQAQVARVEKRGYESYTLNTLRKYVQAIGNGLAVEVKIVKRDDALAPRKRRTTTRSLKQAKRAS